MAVTKVGPNINSESNIKFSDLRKYFLKMKPKTTSTGSETFDDLEGSVSASDLIRTTFYPNDNLWNKNGTDEIDYTFPSVPNCIENELIPSTENNWKASGFVSSVKYLYEHSGSSSQTYVKMGDLFYSARPGDDPVSTNQSRNVRKFYFVNGNIGSSNKNAEALIFDNPYFNITVKVEENILGYGGAGGSSGEKGENGGNCVYINYVAPVTVSNIVFDVVGNGSIKSGGGGGGGGAKGGQGAKGGDTYKVQGRSGVDCPGDLKCIIKSSLGTPGGEGGDGGAGGRGQGYNNMNGPYNGLPGVGGANAADPTSDTSNAHHGCPAVTGKKGGQGGTGSDGGNGGLYNQDGDDGDRNITSGTGGTSSNGGHGANTCGRCCGPKKGGCGSDCTVPAEYPVSLTYAGNPSEPGDAGGKGTKGAAFRTNGPANSVVKVFASVDNYKGGIKQSTLPPNWGENSPPPPNYWWIPSMGDIPGSS